MSAKQKEEVDKDLEAEATKDAIVVIRKDLIIIYIFIP